MLRQHRRAQASRRGRQRVRGGVRVEVAVAWDPDRPVQRARCDGRHQAGRLLRGDELNVETDPTGTADAALQLLELLFTRGEAQAADLLEDPQLLVHCLLYTSPSPRD